MWIDACNILCILWDESLQVLQQLSMFAKDDLDAAVEAIDEVCNAQEEILYQ